MFDGMTYEEQISALNRLAISARWDPQARHDMALRKIQKALELALDHPQVKFTNTDLQMVGEMMGLPAHDRDTPDAACNGGTSIRPSVRKSIDPDKRYRLKSTGEVVTGAEMLKRRREGRQENESSPK